MTLPLFTPGPSGRIPGRAAKAAGNLATELKGRDVTVDRGAADTFEALRITGPAGELFVSIHEPDEKSAVYLAPESPDAEVCSVLGTVDQVTTVAGIIRQRVGATVCVRN